MLKQQLPVRSSKDRHPPGYPRLGVTLLAEPSVVTFSGPAKRGLVSVWGRRRGEGASLCLALRLSTLTPTRPFSDRRDALLSLRRHGVYSPCIVSRVRPYLARGHRVFIPFLMGFVLMDAQVFVPGFLST